MSHRRAFFLLILFLGGCRNRTDLIEAELRTRESLHRQAVDEQRRAEARADALQRELEAVYAGKKMTPEQAGAVFGLKRIVLGRATGGYDLDALPGDEVLQVTIEPRDHDDHIIKAPGIVHILALEVSPQGVKVPLSHWQVFPDKVRQSWKQGLLSIGYTLTLPWQNFPQFESVRVIVRFVTPEGRVFEADRDVRVRLMPGASQRPREPVIETLPAPTPLEPGLMLVPSAHSVEWRSIAK